MFDTYTLFVFQEYMFLRRLHLRAFYMRPQSTETSAAIFVQFKLFIDFTQRPLSKEVS